MNEAERIELKRVKSRETRRKWRAANADKERARHALYHAENADKEKARLARYRQTAEGRATRSAVEARRRAAKLHRTPSWSERGCIAELYADAGLFAKAFGIDFAVDHTLPLQGDTVSGLHVVGNLSILPKSSNSSKHNRTDWTPPPPRFNGVCVRRHHVTRGRWIDADIGA